MAIRLNKVIKDLNVGVQTIVEFLQKKGFEIEAEPNPNAKITEEQYDLLCKEFKTDVDLRKKTEQLMQERTVRKRNANATGKAPVEKTEADPSVQPKAKEEDLIPVAIPEEARPKFKPVGKIDLDQLNKPHTTEKKTEEETKTEKTPAETREKRRNLQDTHQRATGSPPQHRRENRPRSHQPKYPPQEKKQRRKTQGAGRKRPLAQQTRHTLCSRTGRRGRKPEEKAQPHQQGAGRPQQHRKRSILPLCQAQTARQRGECSRKRQEPPRKRQHTASQAHRSER